MSKIRIRFFVFILSIVISTTFSSQAAQAAVTDNIGNAAMEQTIGSWEDTGESHSLMGLMRSIIDKIAETIQNIGGIESNIDGVDAKIDGVASDMDGVDTKIDGVASNIDDVASNINGMDTKIDGVASNINGVDTKIDGVASNINGVASNIDDVVSVINGMESKTEALDDRINTLSEQLQTVNSKIDQQTVALTGSIENSLQKASAAYNLLVYLPKSETAFSYAGQPVMLESVTGNQRVTGTMTDDGTNYSARLYFDFGGSCVLKFNFVNSDGIQYPASKEITITQTGQEVHMTKQSAVEIDLQAQSWKTIHELCQAGIGFGNGTIKMGSVLPDKWYAIGGDDYHLKIWRKKSVGKMEWAPACAFARNYYTTFNTEFADYAYESILLTKSEVESSWFTSNRAFGDDYWLLTEYSPTYSYYVAGSDGDNYISYKYIPNNISLECCPAVFIQ